jgi:segregation and condensation protein B
VNDDERPESLAVQAAAWVPPWERPHRPPDRAYQAAAHRLDDERPDDDDDRSGAGLADDDDDFDEAFEGSNPPGYGEAPPESQEPQDDSEETPQVPGEASPEAPAELAPLPGEAEGPVTVDAPRELDDEPERDPTDLGLGAEVPLPESIEQAAEAPDADPGGDPVDAPLPADGDDAGDVFDAAADDDVGDDGEVDLPFTEVVPDADDGGPADGDAGADGPVEDDPGEPGPAEADPGENDADGDGDQDASGRAGAAGEPGEADAGADRWPPAVDERLVAAQSYAAGAADAEEAFRSGAAGVGDGPVAFVGDQSEAQAPTQGDASSIVGAVPGGGGVPAQGRDARNGQGAVGDVSTRTADGVDLPDLLDDAELAAALEAILLVVDEPVAEMQLAQILEQPTERIATLLEDISARYTAAGHGFDLRRAAGGWRLYTRPEYAAYVERFVLDGQSVRLTQAALETLAVVAYKQPVTRSRISAIRGVNCDGVMRTLVTRGLIEECGTEGETGAYLYRTTALFLEKLGLNSVDQLPPLAPFLPDDVEEVLDATG